MNNVKKRDLDELLPILTVEDGLIYSKTAGDISVAFEVELREIFNCSNEQLEEQHEVINKALKMLNPGTVVAKHDWFVNQPYTSELSLNSDFLERATHRHFEGRPFRNHRCIMVITCLASQKQRSLSQNPITRSRLISRDTLDPQRRQKFLDSCSQLEEVLRKSEFVRLRQLSDEEIAGTAQQSGIIEQYLHLAPNGEKMLVDFDFTEDMIIGQKVCRMFSLADVDHMPPSVGPRFRYAPFTTTHSSYPVAFASGLGMLAPCDHLYTQYLFIIDSDQKLRDLEAKRNSLKALAKYSRKNESAAMHLNDFLNEAVNTKRQLVRMHHNVLVWADTHQELKRISNRMTAAITSIDATPHIESTTAPALYWTGIPGAAGNLPAEETFDGFLEDATSLWNVETNYKDLGQGMLLTDRLSGMPVRVDFSDYPKDMGYISNRNKFIVGGSGSGKSFFTNKALKSYYDRGADIVIIDMGHSYEGLCTIVDGFYFTYTRENYIKFNPFLLRTGTQPELDKVQSIKAIILSLWGKEEPNDNGGVQHRVANHSELLTVENSIRAYYNYLEAHPELLPKFDTYYEFTRDVFTIELQEDGLREKEFDVTNFLFVLKSFYRGGSYDYLLNSDENLDLYDQRFVVFEIDAIKDDKVLFPVVSIIIMEIFMEKMYKKKGVRKILVIEEAWKAIAQSGMAEFIKYLYRTCRKYYGEAWIVTQNIEDILDSPIIKSSIINNADTKIVLDLKKFINKFSQIKTFLGLSEHESSQVLSLNPAIDAADQIIQRKVKEVFASFNGSYSNVWAVEASPAEYFTFTTEELEKHAVRRLAQHFDDYQKAIQVIVEEFEGNYKKALHHYLDSDTLGLQRTA